MTGDNKLSKIEQVAMECLSKMPSSISDTEASRRAARRAVLLFRQLEKMDEELATPPEPLEDLELSVRTHNCLTNSGITTVDELLDCSELDLLKMHAMGKKSTNEVKDVLAHRGLHLKFR